MEEKKKILLTGAAGFIGFHLARALHQRGDLVIGYDSFDPYYDPSLKEERGHFLARLGIPIIRDNLSCKKSLTALVEKEKPTHVVHLAAQAGVRYSLTHPKNYISTNLVGFSHIVELCAIKQIPLLFASSSAVYGTNPKTPFSTEDRTDSPANLYGATKKANELLAYAYHHTHQLLTTGLRFFTVYGPWGRPDMACYLFTEKILKGEPIELFNQGNMNRAFTYIDDIIQGTLAALDREFSYEIFNLGNNQASSLTELITTLETLLGKKAIVKKVVTPPGEIPSTLADISLSQEKLNFSPTTSLQEGLKKFVEWYMTRLKASGNISIRSEAIIE